MHRGLLSSCRCISRRGPPSMPACHQHSYYKCRTLKMTQVQQVFKIWFSPEQSGLRWSGPAQIINNVLLTLWFTAALWLWRGALKSKDQSKGAIKCTPRHSDGKMSLLNFFFCWVTPQVNPDLLIFLNLNSLSLITLMLNYKSSSFFSVQLYIYLLIAALILRDQT